MAQIDFYERTDGKWDWRLQDGNNEIIATSANQGYTDRADAVEGFLNVLHEIVVMAQKKLVAEANFIRQPEEGGRS